MISRRRVLAGLVMVMTGVVVTPSGSFAGEPHPSTTRPQPRVVYPWSPDQSDGTYANPILCADYSDPDVIRDGDDFWLTASSFNCTPGLPILHSRDLVNWTIVNYAIQNLPDPRKVFDQPRHGEGVWAPAIRKHDGKFFIYFPMPDEGIYVVTADDPRGKWSEPKLVIEGKGLIDPCPLWDDDAKAYLVHAYARSRSGIKHVLRVRPMAPDGMSLLGEGQVVYNDPEGQPTLEGPKFHKRDGWYYLSAPAGGVPTGWQLILRSKNVYGPYEPKKVLEQGASPINGPHQGAIVDTPDGKEWWFVHFQETQPYGRILHLQPVEWRDGWPLMGEPLGQPVLRHAKPKVSGEVKLATPQTSDDFDGASLGLQWQWHANHMDDWASLSARKGWLRLRGVSNEADFAKTPNLLLEKLPAREFRAETELEVPPMGQAGLIVMGKSHAALAVAGGAVELLVDNKRTASLPIAAESVRLRVDMADGGMCRFSVATSPDQWKPIGEPFQAVEGVWIGAKVGLFCRGGDGTSADFDYFRFSKP